MEPAQWPGIVDMIEGWFNQSLPAKSATMWYAELRHYDAERVVTALRAVVHASDSPFLPPLGLVLAKIRSDGLATPGHFWRPAYERALERFKHSNDQFQLLTRGGPPTDDDHEALEAHFSPGTVCSAGCGGVGTSIAERYCFFCGAALVADARPPELGGPVPNTRLLGAGPPQPTA